MIRSGRAAILGILLIVSPYAFAGGAKTSGYRMEVAGAGQSSALYVEEAGGLGAFALKYKRLAEFVRPSVGKAKTGN